ncbi:hypothetical protein LOTGIDRAFT_153526 [Lottia gigantea]|uniref:Uncharacterized protein n=1 Tax=Lottia gigantea TaxID=225164 RepID=V3ZRJ4_LOTGI|nr:hypothetical protein LOTGIDRAFT_153526 [Lottia gigantea]ESO94043.1 hypothetical protein LOTGIDRAFT_153526 [Lottia gigantea]
MFDWVKSKCPGRHGKYNVSNRILAECEMRERDTNKPETLEINEAIPNTRETQQHKVQVKVIKNKEVNIISSSVEIVEVISNVKQCPIQNFLTSDDEAASSETASFKDFTDCSFMECTQTDRVDSYSCAQNSQISACVLIDLIQYKDKNSKSFSYETDSDSGRSSLSDQSEIFTSSEHSFCGQSYTESRTRLYLSDSEYSFDSLFSNNMVACENVETYRSSNLSNESVYLSDNEYSFDSDLCLHCEPKTNNPSRMQHVFCEYEYRSIDQSRMNHLSKNSVCLSDICYSFDSDGNSLHSVKSDRNLTQSLSKSSVCLSDSNYSFDTNPESVQVVLDEELPTFNPKIGFGLNRWYKQ